MRVIVCGSRTWTDKDLIWARLDDLPDGAQIVHGAHHSGADHFAHLWCEINAPSREEPVQARWREEGKKAGPLRNRIMLARGADLVIAFRSRGDSRGTDHMVGIARAAGVPVERILDRPVES